MGGNSSKPQGAKSTPGDQKCDPGSEVRSFGAKVKAAVDEELGRRMMIQREVQMAVSIAKARDVIQIFGSAWAVLVGGLAGAKIAGRKVPTLAAVPVVVGGLVLGNIADMAYGNKLARVSKEAEYILDNERARLIPLKQAPVARFYSAEEKSKMFDAATSAGLLFPSSLFSRSFVPEGSEVSSKGGGPDRNF
uniref:Uncharacterized protein n=1 Tax=Minutocellus polymorphus TaxID=265543 RepID=A0A7S0AHY8_9STRA|mmetsp:Transcript_14602/g.24329  ORF Transcript_14602/g.24329 Transcript_14602/m.24329 type:complete len:192 (+) Transcript_14602:145-720(+)